MRHNFLSEGGEGGRRRAEPYDRKQAWTISEYSLSATDVCLDVRTEDSTVTLPGVEVSPECCTALADVSRLVYSQAVLTYLGLK
jgi:hypothetical protein